MREIAETYTKHQAAYLAHALTIDGSAEDNLSKSLASSRVDMTMRFSPRDTGGVSSWARPADPTSITILPAPKPSQSYQLEETQQ